MERKKQILRGHISHWFWYNCHWNSQDQRLARFWMFKRTFDFCSDPMALKKIKTDMFLKYVLLKPFFIFQHGEKHFKYSRIQKISTFEVILIILACIIRALFTQNNCFLVFRFLFCLFVFCFPSALLRRMCSKAKTLLLSVPLRKYLPYCDCLVSRKFCYFWRTF